MHFKFVEMSKKSNNVASVSKYEHVLLLFKIYWPDQDYLDLTKIILTCPDYLDLSTLLDIIDSWPDFEQKKYNR